LQDDRHSDVVDQAAQEGGLQIPAQELGDLLGVARGGRGVAPQLAQSLLVALDGEDALLERDGDRDVADRGETHAADRLLEREDRHQRRVGGRVGDAQDVGSERRIAVDQLDELTNLGVSVLAGRHHACRRVGRQRQLELARQARAQRVLQRTRQSRSGRRARGQRHGPNLPL
jgi:hypothetical protein